MALTDKKKKMYKICIVIFVALVSAVSLTLAKVTNKNPQANPSINNITQAAVQSGVLACSSRIEQVSNFVTQNTRSGAFLFTPPSEPDQRLLSGSLEITNPNNTMGYVSMSFAPNQANGCGALYETVTYANNSCKDVLAKDYPNVKPSGKLGQQTTMLDIGPASRIFLMPATDKACIIIKKEVLL
jgi:hypothetical protein